MKDTPGGLRIAATDLANFIRCRHLTLLDLAKAHRVPGMPPMAAAFPSLQALQARGHQHEAAILAGMDRQHGEGVVRIPPPASATEAQRHELTLEALAAGVPVIYQGLLLAPGQSGEPDFMIRADIADPADGTGGYVVLDAKLARTEKAAAILQTTFYSRLLALETGVTPTWMYLQLGDGQAPHAFRVADYDAYERAVLTRMQDLVAEAAPAYPIDDPYPERVEHCEICSWRTVCSSRRLADDDLSRVAGTTLRQRKALKAAGIATLASLAALDLTTAGVDIDPVTLDRLQRQADIQMRSAGLATPLAEWRDDDQALAEQAGAAAAHHNPAPQRKDPLRGIFALPAPDPGDLFFDLEASRFFGGGEEGFGLEYLFGYVPADGGPYEQHWAFDRAQERESFERFVEMLGERQQRYPNMHVYHYNHYEPTALGRLADRHDTMAEALGALMGRHGTKEVEIDALLRGRVFVDLFPIFRQAFRAGIENYSLKNTERVASYTRRFPLDAASQQLVAFERELEDGDAAARNVTAQADIAAYNEDDCRATLALRNWLEEQREDLEERIGPIIRPPAVVTAPPEAVSPLVQGLLQERHDGLDAARTSLAGLLEYQRREQRPAWWEYFQLRSLDEEGLLTSKSAVAGLEYVAPATNPDGSPRLQGRRAVFTFSFPPQKCGLDVRDSLRDPREFSMQPSADPDAPNVLKPVDGKPWEIVEIDGRSGLLHVARDRPIPDEAAMPRALVTGMPKSHPEPSQSLEAYATEVVTVGDLSPRPLGEALLLRTPPTVAGQPLPAQGPAAGTDFARDIAQGMDRGCLPIQGPPGTGKTYTGARILLALHAEQAGRKFGVTASTHRAVGAFLKELRAQDAEHTVRIGQIGKPEQRWDGVDVPFDTPESGLTALAAGDIDVLGGTAWPWSREEARRDGGLVDTLFIDEAGQIPLAFAIAVSGAAKQRLVLLGDPQQLPQVTQGAHPPGTEVSALAHLLGESAVLSPEQGIFLERTRRMHPDITAFVSRAFYEQHLDVDTTIGLDRQAISGGAPVGGSGLRIADVAHEGNDSRSLEEADRVAELIADLLDRDWTDRQGNRSRLAPEDVKVVTPYNAQIQAIRRALDTQSIAGIDVGTVDRFQGSQAPVIIYSMASSTAEDAPRGMEFLYQLNRLNVAISRAMATAYVVMSPELVRVDCSTPRQMQLASAHCSLREAATAL